ncbi:MAG TPA: hypothetical protein VN709_03305 [Terriglobales bacterium]|nr:hypothetical protein [Terriglobales bacterium]
MNRLGERGDAHNSLWHEEHGWANLYQVAPPTGNPGTALSNAQREASAALLRHILFEHSEWNPRAIVFITESISTSVLNYIEPFRELLGIEGADVIANSMLMASGSIGDVPIAISRRPDARRRSGLALDLATELADWLGRG